MNIKAKSRIRKSAISVVTLTSFILALSTGNPVKADASLTVPSLSPVDLLAQQIKDPRSLSDFMQKNFRYEEDQLNFGENDYWQSPEQMLESKVGDCEDYALFAKSILERNGYAVFLFSIYGEDRAHTIAVYGKDSNWGIFDLDEIDTPKADSLADLGTKIDPHWDYLGIMRQEGNTGLISRKYYRESASESPIGSVLAA